MMCPHRPVRVHSVSPWKIKNWRVLMYFAVSDRDMDTAMATSIIIGALLKRTVS